MTTQSKTILWGTLVSAALFGGLIWLSAGSGKNSNASAEISALAATETSYSFGTVSMAKGNVTHEFKIKNEGTLPVTALKLYTSCMCTQASLITKDGTAGPFGMAGHGYIPSISKVLAPGEEAVILVVFDPAAHGPAGVGPVERQITVELKDAAPLVLGIRAIVAP